MSVTIIVLFVVALAVVCGLVFAALAADRHRRRARGEEATLMGGDPTTGPPKDSHRSGV